MRRIKMVLAVAAALAVMVTVSVAPALADGGNNNDRQLDRKDIRLDKKLLNQNDDNFCCSFNRDFDDGGIFLNDFDDGPFFNDICPFSCFDNSLVLSPFAFSDQQSCWEWSWVFERWEWEC